MKRLALVLMCTTACGDGATPEIELARHEIPNAVCEPALVGSAPGNGSEITEYTWQVDESGIQVDLAGSGGADLGRLRTFMHAKMSELNDTFKPCTWYRDHWMYKTYSIQAAARGPFGPLPPPEPNRK